MEKRKKKRCTVYFLNRAKCVFIFHEGHWRECHTNIRVLLLNKNLSTPEKFKQVCCPVPCVSSCRKKKNVAACLLSGFLVLKFFFQHFFYLSFILSTILSKYQYSNGFYLLLVLLVLLLFFVGIKYFNLRLHKGGSPSQVDERSAVMISPEITALFSQQIQVLFQISFLKVKYIFFYKGIF